MVPVAAPADLIEAWSEGLVARPRSSPVHHLGRSGRPRVTPQGQLAALKRLVRGGLLHLTGPGQVVILLHDGSRLLVSHGLAAASFASLEVALMCLPIADHGLQFACVFLYFIWLLADEAFVKWLDYDIGVLIIRVIAHANNLLLISGAARSDIVFRLPSIPINSIAAVRSVDARGSDLLLLLLLFGEEDVLSEVPSSRISSVWVEIFRLQVRHDVRFRG